MACFITSAALSDPILITVIFPLCLSLSRHAASTARSSYTLITGGTPGGGITCFAAGSILNLAGGISGSSTCLTQTIVFIMPTPLLMPRGHATNDENDEFHEWTNGCPFASFVVI